MKDIPKEIYLTVGDIGEDVAKECSFNDLAKEEVCWCEDKIDDYDIKYVLAESFPHERVVKPTLAEEIKKDIQECWDKMGSTGNDEWQKKFDELGKFGEEIYYFGRFRALEDLEDLIES